MAFDGMTLYAVIHELQNTVPGAKINKIHQPKRDELVISFRSMKGETKLLISANSLDCRLHSTQSAAENPMSPPMFCMLLRKYLLGGKVHGILQREVERIVEISIHNSDEFMRPVEYKLIVEIMGKHSNIILVDAQKGLIIDSLKRISSEVSRYREILPGLPYNLPPLEAKISLLFADIAKIVTALSDGVEQKGTKTISKWLLDSVMGISGNAAHEISHRAGIDGKKLVASLSIHEVQGIAKVLTDLAQHLRENRFEPGLYRGLKAHDVIDFWVFPMYSIKSPREIFATANDAINAYFERKNQAIALKAAVNGITKQLNKHLKKLRQNLFFTDQKLIKTAEMDKYKLWGEILSANLYRIEPGLDKVSLPNFYDGDKHILIPLKIKLSPSQNAQIYFKQYKKLQATELIVKKRRENHLMEVDYLENVLVSLENSETLEEVYEIRREVEAQGYIKTSNRRSSPVSKSEPLSFKSTDGFNIFVGKNNRQNDLLTLKRSKPEDIWVHTKNIPGSHVIIESQGATVSEKALQEACTLAAYFSKAQNSSNVPVDYTLIKHVKKPAGTKPGFVNYTHQKTMYVTPDKSILERLSL